MGLMDHRTPRMVVPLLGTNSVSLRGLNLDDFSFLVAEHIEPMSKIALLYAEHQSAVFSTTSFQQFLIEIVKDFPKIATEVISMSADEPDFLTSDQPLSTGLQISCLTAAMRMTVEDAGGLGNLFAQLQALALNVRAQMELGEKAPRSKPSTGRGASKQTS